MEKERFEALEELNDLLNVCKSCKMVEGKTQGEAEKICISKCVYRKDFERIEKKLLSTLRDRVVVEIPREEEIQMNKEILIGNGGRQIKWTEEMELSIVEFVSQGLNVKEIVDAVNKRFKKTISYESVRQKMKFMRKGGKL